VWWGISGINNCELGRDGSSLRQWAEAMGGGDVMIVGMVPERGGKREEGGDPRPEEGVGRLRGHRTTTPLSLP